MLPCLLRKLPRRRPTRQFRDSQKVLIKNRADKGFFLCTYPVKFNLAFQIVFKVSETNAKKSLGKHAGVKTSRQAGMQKCSQTRMQECT